jgi:hypothetical protein
LQFIEEDFDFARRHVGIGLSQRSERNLAATEDHKFGAKLLGRFQHLNEMGADDQLRFAVAIPDINKDSAFAQVASLFNPTTKSHVLVSMGGGEFAASMCPQHG